MLALRITVNDAHRWTAGIAGEGSAHAVINLSTGRFAAAAGAEESGAITLNVGGLRIRDERSERLRWSELRLATGDRVVIDVVEAAFVPEPEILDTPGGETIERNARRQIEQLRAQLRELEARYPGRL